jgi:pimeloyl-ACP methyl ester carboxylesterase
MLVGHSMGGVVISQVTEHLPAKIKRLVYLTAYLARNGESLLRLLQIDAESLLLPSLIVEEDQTRAGLKEESLREVLHGRCSDADIVFASQNLGCIPRAYVFCLRDRVIGPALQEKTFTAFLTRLVLTPPKVGLNRTSRSPQPGRAALARVSLVRRRSSRRLAAVAAVLRATFDGDYGRVLERAYGLGVTSPTGFDRHWRVRGDTRRAA